VVWNRTSCPYIPFPYNWQRSRPIISSRTAKASRRENHVNGEPSPSRPAIWPSGTLLAKLDEDARRDLLSLSPERRFSPETTLLFQGDRTTHLYVLKAARPHMSACVKVTARLANGAESLLGIRVSGDAVGELALIRGSPRSATVTTCSAVIAHEISRQRFMDFLRRHQEAWPAVISMIADQLDWANQRRLDFTGYPVSVRLARALAALTDRHGYPVRGGHEIGVRLSQEEMGKLIGARRDSVAKAIAMLKGCGFISTQYRGIIIADLPGLRTYAELPF
jgi:CRP/FNR family cyclic AMP-dependent transcriptional regulator